MTTPHQPSNPSHDQQPQVVYVKEPKKPLYKRPGCIIPLMLALLLLGFMGGCMALLGKAANDVDKDLNAEYTVTYKVEGPVTKASVSYAVGESGVATESNIANGWSKETKVKGFLPAHMTTTNGYEENGNITCKILVNGKVVSESTGSGQYGSASCMANSTDIKNALK